MSIMVARYALHVYRGVCSGAGTVDGADGTAPWAPLYDPADELVRTRCVSAACAVDGMAAMTASLCGTDTSGWRAASACGPGPNAAHEAWSYAYGAHITTSVSAAGG